jgi:hypothetical protein
VNQRYILRTLSWKQLCSILKIDCLCHAGFRTFLVTWALLFQRLWHDNIEEPLNKIRALLKILVPEQDQDRWYKSESSVLYTYALVSNKHLQMRYTGCIEKTEQIWNCSQFRKTAISIQCLIYIASLGTYNVEQWKNFSNSNFVNQGGGVFSNNLQMACGRNLRPLLVFWVNGWNLLGF